MQSLKLPIIAVGKQIFNLQDRLKTVAIYSRARQGDLAHTDMRRCGLTIVALKVSRKQGHYNSRSRCCWNLTMEIGTSAQISISQVSPYGM